MARKRSGRKSGKAGASLGLILFLLVCVSVLFTIMFYRQKDSLLVLSNKTIFACDSLLKDSGLQPENADLTIQQVNEDRARPYTYLYRRLTVTNSTASLRELKRNLQKSLASVDQFRRVRILRFSESREDSRVLLTFKIGMSKLVFYNLELVRSFSPAVGEEQTFEEYGGFDESAFPEQSTQSDRPALPKVKARIAIIIDDVGSEQEKMTRKFLSFPGRLTFAVFPGIAVTADRTERIHKIGRFDILVHQPMEPEDRKEMNKSLLSSEIYSGMTAPEIGKILDASFKSVKYASGLNNHQGSAATSDEAAMSAVLRWLKSRNLFFVDSYTMASSLGFKLAARLEVPCQKRDIFLDNENTRDYVQKQLDKLVAVALKKGSAVGIGHINREATFDVLNANYKKLAEQGIAFVLVRDLLVKP